MKLEIDTVTFYRVGVWSFLIIAIANSLSLIMSWSVLNVFSKISGIAGTIFNFALVLFFNHLLKQASSNEVSIGGDIDKIIEEFSHKSEKAK